MKNAIEIFINRLAKIGIEVKFIGNVPWIYLDEVNGNKITAKLDGNHGFTAFWYPVKPNMPIKVNDIKELFKEIRKNL